MSSLISPSCSGWRRSQSSYRLQYSELTCSPQGFTSGTRESFLEVRAQPVGFTYIRQLFPSSAWDKPETLPSAYITVLIPQMRKRGLFFQNMFLIRCWKSHTYTESGTKTRTSWSLKVPLINNKMRNSSWTMGVSEIQFCSGTSTGKREGEKIAQVTVN